MRAVALRSVLCLAGLLACASPSHAQQWGTHTDGSALPQLAPPSAQAVVLFFVASDCPISNRTFPEMRRLREEFTSRGIRFWYVYPNTTEQPATIRSHQAAFDPGGEALQDPSGNLVRLAHAVATPEMAVLVSAGQSWRSVYAGRVDNRYVRLGLERPSSTKHFGEETLEAILDGKSPQPAVGRPVGCAIINPGVR